MKKNIPRNVRVSIGSAIVLGMAEGRLDARPTTIYMLTYSLNKCRAACSFCPQSRTSQGRADMLSRVIWPVFDTSKVIPRVVEAFRQQKTQRVCIQALNCDSLQNDILGLAKQIHIRAEVPISVSCQPLKYEDMLRLKAAGVERVSIALDAVTKELFSKVKGASAGGPYVWEGHFKTLKEAVRLFGKGKVTTHLIAGLGETQQEFAETVQRCVNMGVYPAMFAFTPIKGTVLENSPPPPLEYYRRLQIARYLIVYGLGDFRRIKFRNGLVDDFGISDDGLRKLIRSGMPFRTSGCPGCNRPYYNENPRGPIYNFPRQLKSAEIDAIEKVLFSHNNNETSSS